MNGKSEDILKGKIKELKKLFPEVITEGKVDFDQLKATLGADLNSDNERYMLNWAGKAEAFRILQQSTTATLAPAVKESVDFNNTENIFIEGENLEVLKVLQKSYYGKIKMIYIDPPYNTGNDSFIYPDKFAESKDEYLKRIGEKDEEGYLLKEGLFRKNSKENGQFHSVWLSMMYPRLFLARNLLRDDGVIFISIDDNEVHNLRMVMNEIFGEENFISEFVWKRRTGSNDAKQGVSIDHEYIICYSKLSINFKGTAKDFSGYKNPDNDPRGDWMSDNLTCNKTVSQRPNLAFDIIDPKTGIKYKCNPNRAWCTVKDKMEQLIKEGKVLFPASGKGTPMYKRFVSEIRSTFKPLSSWLISGKNNENEESETQILNIDTNQKATKDLQKLFDDMKIFDYPKPTSIVCEFAKQVTSPDDIILDFFSGSGTTAQAILDLNKTEEGTRQFICVQLPEKCDEGLEAYKAGYKTIADIGKERIRRVIKNIKNEIKENKDLFSKDNAEYDLGFRVFKLKDSNFKIWRSDVIEGKEDLGKQLDIFQEPKKPGAEMNNMMWELLVKSGYELTTKVEEREISKCPVQIIAEGELVICLSKLTETAVKEILKLKPKKVICLDSLFERNDKLKTNTALQMKDAGVEFKTI